MILKATDPAPRRSWSEYRIMKVLLSATLSTIYFNSQKLTLDMQLDQLDQKTRALKLVYGLTHSDLKVLWHEPYCAFCYRSQAELDAGDQSTQLGLCKQCQLAHHCPGCPVNQHLQHCAKLKAVAWDEAFMIQHYHCFQQISVDLPMMKPRTSYHPLSKVLNWYEYLDVISDKQLPGPRVLSPDLQPVCVEGEITATALRAATWKLSSMLTIVAALEATVPDLATRKTLTLHLVGADTAEMGLLSAFEELLHLLPALQTLHYVLVGIDLPSSLDFPDGSPGVIPFESCSVCTGTNRSRSTEMFTGAYEGFIQTARYTRPDLAVAFHTGNTSLEHETQWMPTLNRLIQADHATVFTSYNEEEMKQETAHLRSLGAEFVIKGERNKWQCMIPRLEIAEEVENAIFYENMFWYVIAGTGAGS